MPLKPQRPCNKSGCYELTRDRYCPQHKKAPDEFRGSSSKRGYGYRWQKARAGFLRKHPLCLHCEQEGRVTTATEVDHIVPHRGDKSLFWDRSNWQPLCKTHHSRKTARGE